VAVLVIMRAHQRGTAKGRGVDERPQQPQQQYPPVIVVNPGGGHQQLPQQDAGAVDGTWRILRQLRTSRWRSPGGSSGDWGRLGEE